MGLQVRAAQDVQQFKAWHLLYSETGNYPPARYSAPRSSLPLFLVSVVNDWEEQRDKENGRAMGKREREREFAHRPWLPPTCLCFHQKQPWLSWESLTDSSLYASLLCDSYHTTEASLLCSSSPSYSEGWKYKFPHCIQTWVCHSPHVWRRNENHQNETRKKEKDNQME